MSEFTIKVEGLTRVTARTRDMERRTRDLAPVFRGPIDQSMTEMFRRQFESLGAFGGATWPPLSPAGAAAKARAGFGGMPLLQRTRRMWKSLVASGSSESLRVVEPDSYERGTTVPYAAFHQLGTGRLPQRRIVPSPVPQRLRDTWARVIGAYVMDGTT